MSAPVVFVLGAGASVDLGFPTGIGLRDHIVQDLSWAHASPHRVGDRTSRMRLVLTGNQPFADAAALIESEMRSRNSVDHYLLSRSHQPEVVTLGKLAILNIIRLHELGSTLRFRQDVMKTDVFMNTWMGRLLSHLLAGVSAERPEELFDPVAFINFNYDRSLEHFFYHAVQRALTLSPAKAKAVMERLIVHRPYGSVGPLPWQQPGGPDFEEGVPQLTEAAISSLKTYCDLPDMREGQKEWSALMAEAQMVVFLGFGFDPQNVAILGRSAGARAIFSAYGMNAAEFSNARDLIAQDVLNDGYASVAYEPLKADEFLKNYGTTIARYLRR